jgi:hypothetical protein
MPNGVKKSKKTAAACRKRAIKKQQEEDKKKQEEALFDSDGFALFSINGEEHVLSDKTKGMGAYARKLSTLLKGFKTDIIGYRHCSDSTIESKRDEALKEIIIENKKILIPAIIRGLKKNNEVKFAKTFKKFIAMINWDSVEAGEVSVDGEWVSVVETLSPFMMKAGIKYECYNDIVVASFKSCDEIIKDIAKILKGGVGFTDEMSKLGDGFDIAFEILFNPPSVWDEEKNNKDYGTIHGGCWGSIWIDYKIDEREYRVAVYNINDEGDGSKKWDGKFNPKLVINPN